MTTGPVMLFGKLPAHGDFVARGCSTDERAALDRWLTDSLAAARERFGDTFADRFDAALPWRGAGTGSAAAIAASQDGAGRRYPIVLLRDGDADAARHCEELLYAAIGERWDADRLIAAAGGPPPEPIARWHAADGRDGLDGAMPRSIVTAMLEPAP